jgi:hypothetical protein
MQLRALGVKGVLIKAAELGYITELRCGMPKCFCPEEWGGAGYFEPRPIGSWSYWEPTHEHYPTPKRDGGKATPDNTILAHRLCNKLDYFISHGLSMETDLARVDAARVAAAGNLPQSAAAAEAVAEVFAPVPAPPAKSPRKRKAPAAWRSLPPAELAAHLLATVTITDAAWTKEPRLPLENRESFIRRIVLGETPESTGETAA